MYGNWRYDDARIRGAQKDKEFLRDNILTLSEITTDKTAQNCDFIKAHSVKKYSQQMWLQTKQKNVLFWAMLSREIVAHSGERRAVHCSL